MPIHCSYLHDLHLFGPMHKSFIHVKVFGFLFSPLLLALASGRLLAPSRITISTIYLMEGLYCFSCATILCLPLRAARASMSCHLPARPIGCGHVARAGSCHPHTQGIQFRAVKFCPCGETVTLFLISSESITVIKKKCVSSVGSNECSRDFEVWLILSHRPWGRIEDTRDEAEKYFHLRPGRDPNEGDLTGSDPGTAHNCNPHFVPIVSRTLALHTEIAFFSCAHKHSACLKSPYPCFFCLVPRKEVIIPCRALAAWPGLSHSLELGLDLAFR